MKRRLAIILAVIVIVPLALLAWLGARMLTAEHEVIRHQFTTLLSARLADTDQSIVMLMKERERQLMSLTELSVFDNEALRAMARTHPLVSQVFVLDAKGYLVHPPPTGAINDSEREFLRRAQRLLLDKELIHGPAGPDKAGGSASSPDRGWYAWYWENGLNLIFWRRVASGHIIGVELERTRLMADIIARLPGSEATSAAPHGQIALLDSNGAVAYQWGNYEPPAGEKPRADLALSPPLNAWHLNYYVSPEDFGAGTRAGDYWTLLIGLFVAGAVLLGLALYFYRDYSRDLREAAQRVNFVNQVSHELKTPLTNIRMYAELLEGALPEEPTAGEQAGRYLNVIVAESQRLSRLIANVLTFARQQRQVLTLHRQAGSVDEVIGLTVEQFRPAIEAKNVKITVVRGASSEVSLDADAIGQIIGNLISNVEKYGSTGGVLEIASSQENGRTSIRVADRGPGIPESQREKIFQPFYRISNNLSDGVTGAGIGLSIARELARLHGGDVKLECTNAGACFCVTLATPAHEKGEAAR